MPLELGIWRIDEGLGGGVTRLPASRIENEARLEKIISADIDILGLDVLLIGAQVLTSHGKRIDLLAINAQAELCIIELKRDRTPRDVVAQILDYGSWISGLTRTEVEEIFANSKLHAGALFGQAFQERFGVPVPPELSANHHLVIVASELDFESERIVNYLRAYDISISALFFRYFKDGAHEYLTRSWLAAPEQVSERPRKLRTPSSAEIWNGQDFYVAFGDNHHRSWQDAMQYGFVAAGQGATYKVAMQRLFVGARVFVHLPNTFAAPHKGGYVGIGTVTQEAQPVREFMVQHDGQAIPVLQAPLQATHMTDNSDDPEMCEYLTRVEWQKSVPIEEAVWESGMFALPIVTCKLRHKFTQERLIELWELSSE